MKRHYLLFFISFLILGACSTTKNIPQGSYLLNSMSVKTDTKYAAASDLETFSRQQPNGSLPILGKLRLKIYNVAGSDTSKWLTRTIQNLGEPPVIYNNRATGQTMGQLKTELNNLGYLNAKVDTTLSLKGRKMNVTYDIKGGTPYTIRNYTKIIPDTTIARILAKNPFKTELTKGSLYNMQDLESEKEMLSTILRYVGYYGFSKNFFYFEVDSTLNSHQVDLYLNLVPRRDSLTYSRYKINDVTVVSGLNAFDETSNNRMFFKRADTTVYNGVTIIRGRGDFLRTRTIYRNNSLRKGTYYSEYNYNRTYDAYSQLGAIRQASITLTPSPGDSLHLLDARIILTPANTHWFRANIDGTNSEGDFGIAPSIAYQNQNLFNGSELLSIKLKGAYEFINKSSSSSSGLGQNYYEIGGEVSLKFPQFLGPFLKRSLREWPSATTNFTVGLTTQHRPQYTRQFFNATIDYGWSSKRNRLRHSLSFIDINYVRMPWVSDSFREDYLDDVSNPLLKASYDDQLIARTSYSLSFSNGMRFSPLKPTYLFRTSVETAGLLPRLASAMGLTSTNAEGYKQIMGVNYAEYVKGTFDYSRTMYFNKKHSFAYRGFFGLAYPYGNSKIVPFERRFFAGGANGIRGWSTRSLGPGAYRSKKGSDDFVNQTGDIKIEFSIEDRHQISEMIQLAAFVDAGNIWTLKNYASQAGGEFKFSNFYKEIAVSYGLGLRFTVIESLVLRLDVGVRAYDPSEPQSERLVIFKPRWRRAAWHFAIGYPF